jgi:hypothetical protein
VVRDLVQHDVPDLRAQLVRVGAVQPLERPAKDRDLVGQRTGVTARTAGQRYALVQAEQRLAVRRLVLEDDRHVRHRAAELGRQRVERGKSLFLEVDHLPSVCAHAVWAGRFGA